MSRGWKKLGHKHKEQYMKKRMSTKTPQNIQNEANKKPIKL